MGRPGERSKGFDLLEVFECTAVMLHVEGLREGKHRRRPHGVVKRLRAADAAARAARHGATMLLQLPESLGSNREVHVLPAPAALRHLDVVNVVERPDNAFSERKAHGKVLEHGRGRHHDGVRNAVVDERHRNFLGHPVRVGAGGRARDADDFRRARAGGFLFLHPIDFRGESAGKKRNAVGAGNEGLHVALLTFGVSGQVYSESRFSRARAPGRGRPAWRRPASKPSAEPCPA